MYIKTHYVSQQWNEINKHVAKCTNSCGTVKQTLIMKYYTYTKMTMSYIIMPEVMNNCSLYYFLIEIIGVEEHCHRSSACDFRVI